MGAGIVFVWSGRGEGAVGNGEAGVSGIEEMLKDLLDEVMDGERPRGGGAAAAFVSSFMKLSNSLSRSSAVRGLLGLLGPFLPLGVLRGALPVDWRG